MVTELNKPVVGITADGEDGSDLAGSYSKYSWYALRENYSSVVAKAGGLPVILPHEPDHAGAYLDLIERCAMTFVQSFAALLLADTAGIDLSVSTAQAAAVSGLAAVLAVLKGFAAQRLVGDKSPSLVK